MARKAKSVSSIVEHEIKKMKISDLQGWDRNPREITDEAMVGLTHSLQDFGLVQPIVWNKRTKRVVGGHQRLIVLKKHGIEEVGVVVVDLTPEREKILNVTLNNPEIAGTFSDDIGDILKEIEVDDVNLFDELKLDSLLRELIEDNEEKKKVVEDDIPEPPKEPKTKAGDLWLLGEHRLLCGDSTKRDDVERVMDGEKIGILFADPPYGMRLDADFSKMNSKLKMIKYKSVKGGKYENVIGDHDDFDARPVIEACFDPGEQFWFGADYYSSSLKNTEHEGAWLVWDKRLDESADKMFGSCFELCWSKKKCKRDILRIKWAGIFGMEKEDCRKRQHPNQKPVLLIFEIVRRVEGIIYDPFLGSGTTLIAAEQFNRKCYGIEISPAYCDVIVERWEKFTGKKAKLQK